MKITLKKCKFAHYEIATKQKFAKANTNKKKGDTICDR